MASLNIRNIILMALIVSCFIQVGAQLFALSVVASTIAEAPPRSFAILEGPYRYDSSAFWSTVPPITGAAVHRRPDRELEDFAADAAPRIVRAVPGRRAARGPGPRTLSGGDDRHRLQRHDRSRAATAGGELAGL